MTGVTYFGRYELRALIGSGGMGEVYEALDREQNRLVALKLLPLAFMFDDGVVERFRQESFAAAQLNDPHVIPIHRYGDIDGRLYIDIPTAPTVTVLAKGAGAPITNGNVLSQYLAVTWTGESAGSTWPTAVTDGTSGTDLRNSRSRLVGRSRAWPVSRWAVAYWCRCRRTHRRDSRLRQLPQLST